MNIYIITSFIYSNSLDHSYDPEFCISQWYKCLINNGIIIIHWSPDHNYNTDSADCFNAKIEELEKLFSKYKLFIETTDDQSFNNFLVIQKDETI